MSDQGISLRDWCSVLEGDRLGYCRAPTNPTCEAIRVKEIVETHVRLLGRFNACFAHSFIHSLNHGSRVCQTGS